MTTGGSDMDAINPSHYQDHPVFTGECWEVMQFCDAATGNALKYAWRAGRKDDTTQDLNKALWYIQQLPAPCTPIIPQSVVDRLTAEADPFLEDHESDVLWLTVAAVMHLVRRQYQDAADLVNIAIGRVS